MVNSVSSAFSYAVGRVKNVFTNPNKAVARSLLEFGGSQGQAAGDLLQQTNNLRNVTPDTFEQFLRGMTSTYGEDARESPIQWSPNDPILSHQWAAYIPNVLDDSTYIQSISTPSIRYDQQTRYVSGKVHNYAGVMSLDDISMTLYTEASGYMPSLLSQWVRAIRSQEGLYNLPIEYKRTVIVVLLDQTNTIVAEFRYNGAWPTSWNSYQLQYGPASILATEISLSVDDVSFKIASDGIDEPLSV